MNSNSRSSIQTDTQPNPQVPSCCDTLSYYHVLIQSMIFMLQYTTWFSRSNTQRDNLEEKCCYNLPGAYLKLLDVTFPFLVFYCAKKSRGSQKPFNKMHICIGTSWYQCIMVFVSYDWDIFIHLQVQLQVKSRHQLQSLNELIVN